MVTSSNAGDHAEAGVAGLHTERRIAWLTLIIGLLASLAVAVIARSWIWASGLLIGAVLAWLNFRWLRKGLDALVAASAVQAGAEKPRVPIGTYFRSLFRYALIALIVYVIFRFLRVPLASMIIGMLALAAAAIAASVYEMVRP
jgi:ATP synthase I subunit